MYRMGKKLHRLVITLDRQSILFGESRKSPLLVVTETKWEIST